MPRKRSPETELRSLRSENRILRNSLADSRAKEEQARRRIILQETTITEWKTRFDALLRIVPEKKT